MTGRAAIVAGNGPSLASLPLGLALDGDLIVRTNNFFFEQVCHLGTRVDLAVMGGDPRVAPFMCKTLAGVAGKPYAIGAWTARDDRVARAGRRPLRRVPFRPFRVRDPETLAFVEETCARYQRKPTTGTMATLMVQAVAEDEGIETIVLAGLDLFQSVPHYPFEPGPNHRALMRHTLDRPVGEDGQHDPELDRAIIGHLAELGARGRGPLLRRGTQAPALADLMDLAEPRDGPMPPDLGQPKAAPRDWAGRSGAYPIALLRMLRRLRAMTRRTDGGR